MAFIYVITNDVNDKQYIGKTNNSIEKRFREHILDSKRERCEKRPLYSAMNKYGIEHFHIEELEECSAEESAEREEYWIDKLDTYGHNGYNATRGGDSKKYYDYKEIADKYLELQNQRKTARYFHCDMATVRKACKECNVPILSSQEVHSKSVIMCDINTHKELREFSSIKEAEAFFDREHSGLIGKVCKGKRQSAYGYFWKMPS